MMFEILLIQDFVRFFATKTLASLSHLLSTVFSTLSAAPQFKLARLEHLPSLQPKLGLFMLQLSSVSSPIQQTPTNLCAVTGKFIYEFLEKHQKIKLQ